MSRQERRMSGAFILLLLMLVLAVLIALYFLIGYLNEKSLQQDEDSSLIPELAGIDLDNVDTFSYDYDGTLQTFLKSGDEWNYAEDESIQLDSDLVDSMLQVLENLSYEKIVDDSLVTSSKYGFDDPEMTITLSLSDGTQKILYIGSQNPMVGQYYAVAEGGSNIYTVDSQIVDAFLPVSELEAEEDTEEEDDEDTAESGGTEDDSSDSSSSADEGTDDAAE